MKQENIGELIKEETERRLQIMEKPDYQWPKKATKVDAAFIIAGIAVSIVLIALCMLGVIS